MDFPTTSRLRGAALDAALRLHSDLMAEAHAIIDAGNERGVVLRLTGGLAVRHYAIDLEFAEREYSDIDLIGLKRQVAAVGEVFRDLGYVENRHVAMATTNGQLQFFVPGPGAAAGGGAPATCRSSPRCRRATTSTCSSTPCAWTTRSTSATGSRSTPTPSTPPTSSSASCRSST